MNLPTIPADNPDLIALVEKNRRRFLTRWLILTAVCLIPAVAVFPYASDYYGLPVAILLLLGFVVFPFFACGGWDFLTDKGFSGIVERIDFSVRIEVQGPGNTATVKDAGSRKRIVRAGGRQVNYCTLLVTTETGAVKTLTLRLPGDTGDFPLQVGDQIVKYPGLPFPAVVGCKTPFCVVCGRVDNDGKGECRSCGHSLITLPRE